MHYHCEIIMPPTDDVEGAIAKIMKPWDENDRESEDSRGSGFWDWYSIGGRWAGEKTLAKYRGEKLDAFYAWLKAEKVTVSGIQFGKQELSPADQIPKVDAKWNEMFPSPVFEHCPIFQHSHKPFGKGMESSIAGDVCRLSDIHENLTASRVIVAGPHWDKKRDDIEPKFMLCHSEWNGCNYMKVDWDGKVLSALKQYEKDIASYKEDYAERLRPQPDWLVVTVDYHS